MKLTSKPKQAITSNVYAPIEGESFSPRRWLSTRITKARSENSLFMIHPPKMVYPNEECIPELSKHEHCYLPLGYQGSYGKRT